MDFLSETIKFFKDWQTLIAGILAIIGAWATLRGVDRQINHLRSTEKEERDRKLFAARVALPDALSRLAEYAENWLSTARQVKGGVYDRLNRSEYPATPERPNDAIAEIKNALVAVDRPQAEFLAELLSWSQVHEARLRIIRKRISGGNVERIPNDRVVLAIVDAARLYALSVHLLPWSRRECIEIEKFALGEATRSALSLAKIFPEDSPDVYDMVGVYERTAARVDP